MGVEQCRLIQLPRIADPRGDLTFIEGGTHIPFEIKRVFYLYDVPGGEARGGHAHKGVEELIIAVSGGFTLALDDGGERRELRLRRPYSGVHVPRMIWVEIEDFSSGSVCLVLASERYDESDYVRNYAEFVDAVRKGHQ